MSRRTSYQKGIRHGYYSLGRRSQVALRASILRRAGSSVQFRLATGKKVNSALDNPASFFTAAGLNNRASDLGRLLDNMGQAVKTLEAADKGIKGDHEARRERPVPRQAGRSGGLRQPCNGGRRGSRPPRSPALSRQR